jgi:hypothetical protein
MDRKSKKFSGRCFEIGTKRSLDHIRSINTKGWELTACGLRVRLRLWPLPRRDGTGVDACIHFRHPQRRDGDGRRHGGTEERIVGPDTKVPSSLKLSFMADDFLPPNHVHELIDSETSGGFV